MTAKEILQYFLDQSDWVDKKNTVDKIIIGDENKEIHSVLVTWMIHDNTINYAIENGFDMIMTHEPTFWFHADELSNLVAGDETNPKIVTAKAKAKKLLDHNLVVIRNHDVWDRFPKIGIPYAFANELGFTQKPSFIYENGYMLRYDINPIPFCDFYNYVKKACSGLGEPNIQVFGDANKLVQHIGIGTGCYCYLDLFMKQGCDVAIFCDDGQWYWRDVSWAIEANYPMVKVNHGTSEEAGMKTLATYIIENLPLKTEYYAHQQGFRTI